MKKIKMIILRWALRLATSDKKHREAILRHELNHLAMERICKAKAQLGIAEDEEINVWHPRYAECLLGSYDEHGVICDPPSIQRTRSTLKRLTSRKKI